MCFIICVTVTVVIVVVVYKSAMCYGSRANNQLAAATKTVRKNVWQTESKKEKKRVDDGEKTLRGHATVVVLLLLLPPAIYLSLSQRARSTCKNVWGGLPYVHLPLAHTRLAHVHRHDRSVTALCGCERDETAHWPKTTRVATLLAVCPANFLMTLYTIFL